MRFIMILLLVLSSFQANAMAVADNAHGRITLVEYYDYECPHCRHMQQVVNELASQYPQLRIIERATPVLNPVSRRVASLVLASQSQHDFHAMHQALMALHHPPTIQDASMLAQALGLNVARLKQVAQSSEMQQALQTNIRLAGMHSSDGVLRLPIFVIGKAKEKQAPFVLIGEQPYRLFSAIIQHLSLDE